MKSLSISLFALGLALSSTAQASQPTVNIDSGSVSGASVDGVDAFKGIPFAAPPLGDLRWRAPQPIKPWTGVRQSTEYGHDCMQTPFGADAAPLGTAPSEDCLVVNVWRPAGAKAGDKLPILFWIYGGGFVNGGSSPSVYAGDAFAKKGVIMVSFNYRLGRFGFFGFPELTRENRDDGLLGNYGYMDQIAALKWVQRNIAAFGGDPSKVTIFGESAGGLSVNTLVASPLAKGLFRAAIVESGAGRGYLGGARELSKDKPGLQSAETLGVNLAKKNGIEGTGAEALSKLRALSAEQINDGLSMVTQGTSRETYGGPVVDGKIVIESPQAAFESGRQNKVAYMIGINSADSGFGFAATKDAAFAPFGPLESQARKAYDPDGTASLQDVNARIAMDKMMSEPARYLATTVTKQGLPAYEYRFGYVADSMKDQWKSGAPHATEIPYVMNTVKAKYGAQLTATDAAIADQVNSYWANFAKTGNPNGAGLPHWPRYDAASDQIMMFEPDGKAVASADPWKARLDIINAALDLPPPPPTPTRTPDGHYSAKLTPIEDLMKDPTAKAVLEKHVPDVVKNPNIGMAGAMTLIELKAYVPQLTDDVMATIDRDLAALPAQK